MQSLLPKFLSTPFNSLEELKGVRLGSWEECIEFPEVRGVATDPRRLQNDLVFVRKTPSEGLSPESTQRVLDEYLGDTEDPIKIRERFQDLMGDVAFVVPTVQIARKYRDSGAPVYLYEFQHRPSMHKNSRPDFVNADHGDEIVFVFGWPLLMGNSAEDEKQLSRTIMRYWANFARTGNPNGRGLVEWPRYDHDEGYLELNLQQRKAKKLRKKQVDFWIKILHDKVKKTEEEGMKIHLDL